MLQSCSIIAIYLLGSLWWYEVYPLRESIRPIPLLFKMNKSTNRRLDSLIANAWLIRMVTRTCRAAPKSLPSPFPGFCGRQAMSLQGDTIRLPKDWQTTRCHCCEIYHQAQSRFAYPVFSRDMSAFSNLQRFSFNGAHSVAQIVILKECFANHQRLHILSNFSLLAVGRRRGSGLSAKSDLNAFLQASI